jgi:hypothetical protein
MSQEAGAEGSTYIELDQPAGEGSTYIELDQSGPEGTIHTELDKPPAEIGDIDQSVRHGAEVAAADHPVEEDSLGNALAAAPVSGGISVGLGHSAAEIAVGEAGAAVLEHSVSVDTSTTGTPASGPEPGDAGVPAGTSEQGTYLGEVDDPGFTADHGTTSASVDFAIPDTEDDSNAERDGFGEDGWSADGPDLDNADNQDTVYAPDSGDTNTADLDSSVEDSSLESPEAEPSDFDVPGRSAYDLITETADTRDG